MKIPERRSMTCSAKGNVIVAQYPDPSCSE